VDYSKIPRYLWIGRHDQHWYHDCEKTFVDLFGADRLGLVTKIFAATSINTSLKSNITLFRKALYESENDKPVGKYLPNIQMQLERVRAGQDLSGRKIRSFAAAMAGDKNAVVVDVWISRAFGVDRRYFRQTKGAAEGVGNVRDGGVSDKHYTLIENWVRAEAAQMGLQPREFNSMIWAGVRIDQSGNRETHYKTTLINKLTNLFNCI
jgi:hypothetical protein